MAPLPQEPAHATAQEPAMDPISDDDLVITGVSGAFPNCDSFQEFAERLYNKENMVNKQSGRWSLRHPDLVPYLGQIRGIENFDAQFFMVYNRLAHATEPIARKMFEHTYQAIFDSGICPNELSELTGGRVGVYVATTVCSADKVCESRNVNMGLLGCSKNMFANRISYFLNLKGPSITMDGDSAGSLLAMDKVCQAIKNGYCDAAIIGSGKLVLHPQVSIMYNCNMALNSDGKTKCYDSDADGPSLSEAITVMFVQKYKDAKRVYGVLKHAMAHFAATDEQICAKQVRMPRDVELLTNFYESFYKQAGVSPAAVKYVEGYGAAIPEMDKLELQAVDKVFCKDRQDPLLFGSVASNIGFTDSTSGLCGIFKIILGYQRGQLAANLHCDSPRQDVEGVRDGRLRIITEHARCDSSYTAINSFTGTGINAHALLQGYPKPKDLSKYQTTIPYLVTASGRQESAVLKILDNIESLPLDPEEIALIHNIHKTRITKHLARGFGIFSPAENNKTEVLCKKVDYYDDVKQPLWFVYSGMGSQWVGMGKQLMRIPVFADSIARCHKALEPKGLDLIKIITCPDKSIFDNVLHSFVGISAIQIALTDLLTMIGLVPDKIMGHSLGELGCAYADGCLTTEETMILSYLRGIVSISIPLDRGAMAAVGIGYKQLSKICPPDIDIACHNSATSSTISGPIEAVQKFVNRLTDDGIFAKEVQCSNIAYHSRYIQKFGPELLRKARELLKAPKLRSERWVSTSVPSEKWNERDALYSSAEYHANNLLSTVLFEEALRFVPPNAVVVEVAPHSLLSSILKEALPNCRFIPLTRRSHPDNALFCLEGIGNVYMAGYDPNISALYPKVEFPVSSSTRSLGHLVEWAHNEKWNVYRYLNPQRRYCSIFKQIVTVHDDEFEYLKGHVIEGTRVIPYAACLVAAWDCLAMTLNQDQRKLSVQFLDVKFHCQLPLLENEPTYLYTSVQRGSGVFEVHDGNNTILIEGVITHNAQKKNPPNTKNKDATLCLNREDIYKLLYERGYNYTGPFRSIHSMNASMTKGLIEWNDNWVTFIDAILQTNVLLNNHAGVSSPKTLQRMLIDFKENVYERISGGSLLEVNYDEEQYRTRCGGVTIEHIHFNHRSPAKGVPMELRSLKFVPFDQPEKCDVITATSTFLQIISENITTNKMTLYFVDIPKKHDYVKKILKILQTTPDVALNIINVTMNDLLQSKTMVVKPDAVFMHELLADKTILEDLYHTLPANTFIISIGLDSTNLYPSSIYQKVSSFGNGRHRIELARFRPTPPSSSTTAVTIRSMSDLHQLRTTCEELPSQQKLLVLAPHPAPLGLKDQVKFWRKNCRNVYMVLFDQRHSLDKELDNIPDMAVSVLHEGIWGGEYYVPTKIEAVPPKGMVSLTCMRPGDLNSLSWVEADKTTSAGIDVTVHYAGLVGRDASRAQGEVLASSAHEGFGMDFSGVTASGERVMGLVAHGSAASTVKAHPNMLWPIPAHWTLEDAATVPFAYCYALYILTIKYLPRQFVRRSILINGGAGALGQALISVSLALGMDIFVTVSDMRKKRFLKKLFPELKAEQIGNSRDVSFKDMVKHSRYESEYDSSGVFIVVNCCKGELKTDVANCCTVFGFVIDTNQLTSHENFSLGMQLLSKQRAYIMTDFSSIFAEENQIELRKLQLMLSEGIVSGFVKPLSRVTYAPQETVRAFRLLAASRHRGRVLLNMQESLTTMPRISCQRASSYLVIYDDEDFGVQFADLLVRRGAKRLILHAKTTSYLKFKIQHWEKQGARVDVSSNNLKNKRETLSLLEQAISLGNLDGVYLLATHSKQKPEFTAAILSNLDLLSRKVSPNLRHFAIIGEEDWAWRDTITERAQNGLPALSLVLPKLEQFQVSGSRDEAKSAGFSIFSTLETVEKALFSGDHVVAAHVLPSTSCSLLEEVAKLPGVNITNATVDRTSLEQVGVDYGRARELCSVLQEKFHITLAPELLPKMTIGQLKLLKEHLDIERDLPGFEGYISTIDEDEIRATNEVLLMPTLVHRSHMKAYEFDLTQDCLCIIPGLEGNHQRFHTLCERLKIPAVVFQFDDPTDTLQEAAQRLANSIMKNVQPKQRFYLLGYEFGVMLSLEVAAILESYGMTGTVYLLGGTPEDIYSSFIARWNDSTEEAMQDTLLQHMYTTITGTTSIQLEDELRQTNNWPDKLESLVKVCRQKVAFTSQYITGITEGIYSRIKLLQGYNIQQHKLQSKIILIQAKPFKSSEKTLKNITSQEPIVKNLNATLAFAHRDLRVSNIINTYLGSNVLHAYNCSNQCDTALVNDGDNIMLSL